MKATSEQQTIGILLTNLGTPQSPSIKDVRRYLKEFLSDRRVIDTPRLLWWLILNIVILNTRPKKSAKAYQKVWTDEGSPLLAISKQQAAALQQALIQKGSGHVKVVLAMRYGQPNIQQGLAKLKQKGANRILVFPLYPQYSATTTASTFDAVNKALVNEPQLPELRFINRYYTDPNYIDALAASVQDYWQTHGRAEKLIFSLHGIPKDYCDAGDPYQQECIETTQLLAQQLGLKAQQWMLTFQSRLGPRQWLEPYTDKTLAALAKSGTKSVQLVCPGFSADCLETLEEIQMENRVVFMEAGGAQFDYIPCLNTRPDHIEMMTSIVLKHIQHW